MSSHSTRIRPVITGEKGFLRKPRAADRAEWCRLRRSSGRFLARWEPRKDKPIGSPKEFDGCLVANRSRRNERYLLCSNTDKCIVGQVSIMMIERGPFQNATLGYWIGKPFVRKGWGKEMVTLAIRRAFEDLDLQRLEANILPSNKASKALVGSLGFRNEGYSIGYLEIDGKRRDHERWAIIRREWEKSSR